MSSGVQGAFQPLQAQPWAASSPHPHQGLQPEPCPLRNCGVFLQPSLVTFPVRACESALAPALYFLLCSFFFLNHGFQDTYAILQTAALFEIGDRLVLGITAYSQYFYLSTDGTQGEGGVEEGWTGAETRQKVHREEEEGKKVA